MIIGITGTNASGKEMVAEILGQSGFSKFSCSDVIREVARTRGLSTDRGPLTALANELRAAHGPGVLGRRVYEMIKEKGISDAVVVSIRNPMEAEALKAHGDFFLLWVDADPMVRYRRSSERKRDGGDLLSFEGFMALERAEHDAGPTGCRLNKMQELASFTLRNDGSMEELRDKVLAITARLR